MSIPTSATLIDTLVDRIETKRATAGVIGLGYVGLPLALELARAGINTVSVDIDTRKVEAVNRGESYIPDVDSKQLGEAVSAKKLRATADFDALADADTIGRVRRYRPGTGHCRCSKPRGLCSASARAVFGGRTCSAFSWFS